MEKEKSKEKAPKIFKIDFIYDPHFTPHWYEKGAIDIVVREDIPIFLYTIIMSDEWNNRISPQVSPVIEKTLAVSPRNIQPQTAYVLKHRVKVSDNLFIESHSNPLAIWARPKDPKWEYLPFHARVIHDLGHILGPGYSPLWEVFEEEVKNIGEGKRDLSNNRPLLEELVVRNKTYQITKEVFGQEFADWFLDQESKTLPNDLTT